MFDATRLLAECNLPFRIVPREDSCPLTGSPAGMELTFWQVEIGQVGDSSFAFPVAIARESGHAAPTLDEAFHFLKSDLDDLAAFPDDDDWLAHHSPDGENASDWVAAKRDVESIAREMSETMPDAFVAGIYGAAAGPSVMVGM